MTQNGYLFTAGVTVTQKLDTPVSRGGTTLQTWDTCMSAIVQGEDATSAQRTFEEWCQRSRENEAQTELRKILGAQLVSKLLTESGGEELGWNVIAARVTASLPIHDAEASDEAADHGEGYWVNINEVVPSGSARLDVESLKRDLPEDVASTLNWSLDKKFIFLVSSLAPQSMMIELHDEFEDAGSEQGDNESEAGPILDPAVASLPEMRDKEAAALVEARNSVVAAWLWRKFVTDTPLATNEILLNPCCAIIPGA